MKECNDLIQKLIFYSNRFNLLIKIIAAITILSVFSHVIFFLLIIANIIIILVTFKSSFRISYLLDKYIKKNHLIEFREFQKSNFFLGISNQRLVLFIKSKYFVSHDETEEKMVEELIKYGRNTYKIMIVSFISIFIITIISFIRA